MKKRILSILLTLCMMLCLTPMSVFAEEVGTEGSAAIQLGADALSVLSKNVNTATAPTVYFGQNHENNPAAWRVIGYDGSGVTSSKGDITLLAAGAMGVIPFVDTILNNEYAPSNLKTAIDALAEKLTTEENAAVKKRTLTSGSYDGENTDCVAGGQVDNAVFWPLSAKEAIAVNNDLRALDPAHPNWVTTGWWLRSPGSDKYHLAVVRSEGSVQYSGYSVLIFNNYRTVRPAFNLNMNSVLFASAAVGGKPDGGLTEVSKYSGNEWKLTLLDSRRNFAVTEKTVSAAPDDTVTLNYKGATTGKNEYISVILADNNGAQYYGRVAQPTAKSGTVEIKIPSDIAPGDYTMKVFSEQYNGDCKTDLASAFADVTLTVESQPDEQFTLAPGGRYYFDLSAMNIPGTVNSNLPDSTLHYVPFTYAGTVNAYKLTSEMATTEEYAQKNKYPHSLFIADYAVTHTVSWDDLNTAGLIFGKNYASGGVDYTLRAPSVGSDNRGSGDSERGTPQSNEWDRILDKDSGYIKNWNGIYSWGQDTTRYNSSLRAIRGYDSGRRWNDDDATDFLPLVSFRPVLEILNPDTLSSDGLKVVTLDLGGGTLGGSSEDIQIIVKNGSEFTAPASDGMTRPDGNTGSYFMWRGSNGKLYAPGASVPADVTKLTAQFALSEQFSLTPGGRYYFDLSAMNIPGTVNSNLPDSTLHYVPFTYAGTVNAYKLTSEMATTEEYAQKNKYPHSLFIADYVVTHTVSWDDLNTKSLIFGKDYASGGVDYTLRAPSVGSNFIGLGNSERGVPQSNEWDTMLNKNSGYIQNWNDMYLYLWGQDTVSRNASRRAVRGCASPRFWINCDATYSDPSVGFRPVLEVLNPDTLGSDGLKVVTLDLGGGTLGGSSEDIQIIVKNGESFTAPSAEGLPRPDGISEDAQLYWTDENGNCYKPGDTVPADVSMLSITGDYEVIYLPGTYGTGSAVTDMKPHNNILTLRGALFTRAGYTQVGWSTVDGGEKVYGFEDVYTKNEALTLYPVWNTNKYTITFDTNGGSEIAPITQDYGTQIAAPANPTRKGYTFKGWDKEIPETMPAENITVKAQWEINQYTITFDTNGGSEIAPITQDYGTEITAPDKPTRKGYTFKGWDKEIPETMPAENITVKAQWEINQYTITFDTNGGSEIAPITQDYGTEITAPDNPTRKGYTFKGWDKEIPETMPAENITITARWRDTEKPTGEIIIGTNKWNEFLNELTFGIFFKDTQEVTINAVDNSGVVFVSYLVTDKELSEAELNSLVFRAYEEPFRIEPNGEYIIYVMLVDENINITYLRSDRITLDNIQPVISGIENGKTYCEAQTVTVDEKNVDTVTVNGTVVTLDADGGFVLPPTNDEQKIVVTDKAGNNAEMTVTVNNGHTFGEWVSDNDGKHTRKCIVDGCDVFETENCSGGNATCTKKAVCDVCGKAYGEPDGTNHEGGVQEWTTRTAFVHEQKWNCCGAVIVASEAHEWKDGVCQECGYVCLHNDTDKNHICDYCEKTISEHEDADKNHICDYCKKTISEHEDKDKNHICDYCEKTISEHEDADKNHICDYCEKIISEHEDTDKNHICDYCGKGITNHSGGKATCTEKAVCEICNEPYGEIDGASHADLRHIEAKTATKDAEGNVEYWYCEACNKYYSDEAATKEIKKTDTVTAKLPDSSKSPQTGDNSNLILWIALLFISGGVMKGVTAFDKLKKHSAKIKDK
ncbi:InlB B-repeat-containing protein [Ruminococcus bromii]|uniref:InlB B-repeat-containing protein n=1 Tax=Ruminococcus bromii TaxID=40518 RepID=UPI003A8CB47C